MGADVLMEEGDWSLVRMEPRTDKRPGFRTYHSNFESLVKHVCYPNGRADGVPANTVHQVVTYPDDSKRCWRCGDDIPDNIKTAFLMHNWEVIQTCERH